MIIRHYLLLFDDYSVWIIRDYCDYSVIIWSQLFVIICYYLIPRHWQASSRLVGQLHWAWHCCTSLGWHHVAAFEVLQGLHILIVNYSLLCRSSSINTDWPSATAFFRRGHGSPAITQYLTVPSTEVAYLLAISSRWSPMHSQGHFSMRTWNLWNKQNEWNNQNNERLWHVTSLACSALLKPKCRNFSQRGLSSYRFDAVRIYSWTSGPATDLATAHVAPFSLQCKTHDRQSEIRSEKERKEESSERNESNKNWINKNSPFSIGWSGTLNNIW
jgi:hypothetical protein